MTINFEFIGWCNTTESDGSKHDKVWTAFEAGGSFYAGWGARGKKLSFKKHTSLYALNTVKRQKLQKGYNPVDAFQLFAIFPDFEETVDKMLMFATLSNKVK